MEECNDRGILVLGSKLMVVMKSNNDCMYGDAVILR